MNSERLMDVEEPDAPEVCYSICCGIDVHKASVVACLLRQGKKKIIKKCDTDLASLRELARWLKEENCEIIAMESTGIYWRPLYNVFEEYQLKAMVVNAAHMRNVPGKKSDISDAQWIARLLRQGLLKASFIPERDQRDRRDITRYRRSMVHERTRDINRLHKILESNNIKLSTQMSDINGKTSRQLIDDLLKGEVAEKEELIDQLPTQKMKGRAEKIWKSLQGDISASANKLIRQILEEIDRKAETIEALDQHLEHLYQEDEQLIKAIDEIPGIGETSAQIILAEIGTDMSKFSSSERLTSWAGVSPTKNESAGKKKAQPTGYGNKTLKTTLIQCARSAIKNKEQRLYAQYQKIQQRRGDKRAIVAVARTLLTIIYHMIKDGSKYEELGKDYRQKGKKRIEVTS